MPQVINTNVMSLNAQRNLNKSQNALGTTLQRLSSGLRINSAKDDAAGLSISNRMTAQIRGVNQAARNAADAISLAQTGEGGIQEITNNLQRMRELSVQSRNATNTDSDRASLDLEFQQLMAEIDRTATTTAFNGRNVLDGSLGTSVFQVGANVGETVAVNVSSSMRTSAIGNFAARDFTLNNVTGQAAVNLAGLVGDTLSIDAAGEILIDGIQIAAADDTNAVDGRGDGSAFSIGAAINASTDVHGVTATVGEASITFTSAQVSNFAFTDDLTTDDTLTYSLTINGQLVTTQGEAPTITDAAGLVSAINSESANTGVTATTDVNSNVILTAQDGRNIEISEVLSGATEAADQVVGYFGNTLIGIEGTTATAAAGNIYKGTISLSSEASFLVESNDGAAVQVFAEVTHGVGSGLQTNASTINAANVLTEAASDLAIRRIDVALRQVDGLRGTFGAIQARFESTVANLQTTAENVSAARSRIRDADFASETANLTRAQILQQAGVSILTQANALPQLALALLQ